MRKGLTTTTAVLGICMISGCGGNDAATTSSTTAAPTTAAPPSSDPPTDPTPAVTTSAAPVATTPAEPKLGTAQSLTDWNGDLKVTVISYKQPVAKSAPQPDQKGYEYGSLVVKVCNADDHTQTVNTTPFRLVYADDTEIESASTGYDQFPKPEFPWGDHSLAKGRCVKGSIVFEVPKKARPHEASYVAEAEITDDLLSSGEGSVTYWRLR